MESSLLSIADSSWPARFFLQETGGLSLPEIPPVFGLLAVLFLVLLNGFFVATEFALVAVRRSRIEQLVAEGHRTAPAVRRAIEHLDNYVAGTQFGITLASLALGWVGEPALSHLIEPLLNAILPVAWAEAGSQIIAVTIAFAIITALHMILGEFAPKGVALQRSEATALFVAIPMSIFLRIFRPFIALINILGTFVLRLLGLKAGSWEESIHSVEELRYVMKSSREAGVLESTEEEIVGRALGLGDLTAHSVMVPRTEMISVPVDIPREELLDLTGQERHVRFPVHEGNTDNVIGIIHVTDVVAWEQFHPDEPFSVRAAMRSPLLVPESIKADRMLSQLRAARTHTAIVVDEFGGVAGMVTLQDVLERLVGEIPEMDEDSGSDIEVLPNGSVRIDGLTLLTDLEDRFALNLAESDAETVGGYVLETLGRVPDIGEELELESYRLRITEMDGPRVAQVVLSK